MAKIFIRRKHAKKATSEQEVEAHPEDGEVVPAGPVRTKLRAKLTGKSEFVNVATRRPIKKREIPADAPPIIEVENVSRWFPPDVVALDEINITIKQGEFVSLVGRSGAGKSTLTNMIIGRDAPSDGELFVNGWDMRRLKRRHRQLFRREIGVVFQEFLLLEKKTVFENVAFALVVRGASRRQILEDVPRMIALVGLAGKEDRFPHELSGGERQRVAIARAFVHQPKLLVADEPTGNLDALYAWEIIEVLLKVNDLGTTVLLATHDRDIVNRLKRRVITLENGRVLRDQEEGEYVI